MAQQPHSRKRRRHHKGAGFADAIKKYIPYTRGLTALENKCGIDTPDDCLMLGCQTNKITRFFQFETLKYADYIQTISPPNAEQTSIMNLIGYKRNGATAHAVLKSTLSTESDNLYLEAYNGLKYVNDFAVQFPTWLETYGAYEYAKLDDRALFQRVESPAAFEKGELATILKPAYVVPQFNAEAAKYACKKGQRLAILMQYIPNAIRFDHWLDRIMKDEYTCSVELPLVLFQIYSVLAQLSAAQVFTHYDLHYENVLIYEIPRGKYLTMTYTGTPFGAITFKTRYLVKICDYGHSFFPDNPQIYQELCATELCTVRDNKTGKIVANCGAAQGFGFFTEYNDPRFRGDQQQIKMLARDRAAHLRRGELHANDYFTNSTAPNNAHDLRLAFLIWHNDMKHFNRKENVGWIRYILGEVGRSYHMKLGAENVDYIMTQPANFMLSSYGLQTPIKTVTELYWTLCNLIQNIHYLRAYMATRWRGAASIGTITVDLNYTRGRPRPFTFVKGDVAP